MIYFAEGPIPRGFLTPDGSASASVPVLRGVVMQAIVAAMFVS